MEKKPLSNIDELKLAQSYHHQTTNTETEKYNNLPNVYC